MENYKLIQNGTNGFIIKETSTNNTIKIFKYQELKAAKLQTKSLNSGNGFNGFTPKFFAIQ